MTSENQKQLAGEKDRRKKALLRYQGLKGLHNNYYFYYS